MENIKYQKVHVDSIRITKYHEISKSIYIFHIHKHFKLLLYNKLLIFFSKYYY